MQAPHKTPCRIPYIFAVRAELPVVDKAAPFGAHADQRALKLRVAFREQLCSARAVEDNISVLPLHISHSITLPLISTVPSFLSTIEAPPLERSITSPSLRFSAAASTPMLTSPFCARPRTRRSCRRYPEHRPLRRSAERWNFSSYSSSATY